jgi:RecB family exonuclease
VDARLWVLPSADRVEEELLRRARESGGAALGLGLSTVRELESALFAAAELAPIDRVGAELIASSVLGDAEAGQARGFLAVYDALRAGGGTLEQLSAVARRLPGLSGRRAQRIARFARDFEGALAERGLTDEEGARARLAERLPGARLPDELARAGGIVVEDLIDLSPARVRWLAAIAGRGLRVLVRVPQIGDRAGLAGSLELLERALSDSGAIEIAGKEYGTGRLAAWQRRLFQERGAPSVSAPVRVIEGDDPAAELRAIVAAIRSALDAGAAPEEIGVAVRGIAQWRSRLGNALDEAGLPWRDRRGAPALEAPPCALALAVIDLAMHELPRPELSRVLTSRYVDGGIAAAAGEPYLPARRVAELLRIAGSRDDRGEGHASRLLALGGRLGDDKKSAGAAVRAGRRLGELLPLLRLPSQATIAGHLAALGAALDRLGVPGRSRAREEREEGRFPSVDAAAARALARDQAGVRALAALDATLTGAARRAGFGNTAIPLARFRALFSSVIEPATLAPRGARGGAVMLLEAGELAGRTIPHLILAGVVDGRFPQRRSPSSLFDDDDRAAFNRAAGREIFSFRGALEPLRFFLACAAARESLTITATRADEEARETVRSAFLDETLAAIGQERGERVVGTVVAPAESCSSSTQLLVRAALLSRGAEPATGEPANALLAAVRADEKLGPRLVAAERRARADRPGGAGGKLSSEAALAALAGRLAPSERSGGFEWMTSAGALENYAACPFQFFAARILRLDELDPLDDDLDNKERGSLLHAVAREVWSALADEKLLPLRGGERAAAERAAALAACDRRLDQWQAEHRTGPEPFWALRRQEARGSIVRLVEAEAREGWTQTPSALEAAFGLEGAEPLVLPAPEGDRAIAVRGRVDRLDAGEGKLTVIDYKSGLVRDRLATPEIGRTQFQLPLYAAWARARHPLGAIDAIYRSLRDGSISKRLDVACSERESSVDALVQLDPKKRAATRNEVEVLAAAGALDLPANGYPSVADSAWALYRGVRAGRFDVRPHDVDAACAICAFATVCRVDLLTDEEEPE